MRIAVIGDVHGQWGDEDIAFFNGSEVDALLFVGDLAAVPGKGTLQTIELLKKLRQPFALIPGNHDCGSLAALGAEFFDRKRPARWLGPRVADHWRAMGKLLGQRLLGYSSLDFSEFTVVGARPWAMDGGRLTFQRAISEVFGVHSLADSADKIRLCLEQAGKPIVVLAHNGPKGLGTQPQDMFGIDFRPEGGDNGDADLALALEKAEGVSLVLAGHMHHAWRGGRGALRTYVLEKNGVLYVNAARVPRRRDGRAYCILVDMEQGRPARVLERWYAYGTGAVEDRAIWAIGRGILSS